MCPVGDLKSVLPGGPRPPAPPLEDFTRGARRISRIRLGGGMFSFFTELNRKRPPAQLLDFVMNTTCPIVHAADDRSVMETLEALPYQVITARSFIGKTPYRVGSERHRLPRQSAWRDLHAEPGQRARVLSRDGPAPARAVRRGLDAGLHRHVRAHRRRGDQPGRADRAAGHHLPQDGLRAAVVRRRSPAPPCIRCTT